MNKRIMGLESEYGAIILLPNGKFDGFNWTDNSVNRSQKIENVIKKYKEGFSLSRCLE